MNPLSSAATAQGDGLRRPFRQVGPIWHCCEYGTAASSGCHFFTMWYNLDEGRIEEMKVPLFYSYRRCSAAHQKKGTTIARQDERIEMLAARLGCKVDAKLRFDDWGVSAGRGQNVEIGRLGAFLRAIEAGDVPRGSILGIEQLDRMSRQDVLKAVKLFICILDAGVRIATYIPERVYDTESTGGQELIEVIGILTRAHEDWVRRCDLLTSAWSLRRAEARVSKKPLSKRGPAWLKLRADRSGWDLRQDRVQVVQRMVRESLAGTGATAIVGGLIRDGEPTFGGAKEWSRSSVRKILASPALYGTYQPLHKVGGKWVSDGEPIDGYYTAILDKATWDQLQHKTRQRCRRRGRVSADVDNLFTELVWDARLKCKMRVIRQRPGNGRSYLYLQPSSGERGAAPGRGSFFPYPAFEAGVRQAIHELKVADLMGEHRGDAVQARIRDKVVEVEIAMEGKRALQAKAKVAGREAGVVVDLLLQQEDYIGSLQDELRALHDELRLATPGDLGVTQSTLAMEAKAKGEEKRAFRLRLRAQIPDLIESIWVLVERYGTARVAHVQVWFHTGTPRYFPLLHDPFGAQPDYRRLDGVDLRKGGQET